MISILNSELNLTEVLLNNFELVNNVILPSSYRKLISMFNGGQIQKDHTLELLYSIEYGENTVEFARQLLQIIEQLIPLDYLPIGSTATGNEIAIGINTADINTYEKIFIFWHDEYTPIKLSDSLEDFLQVKKIEDLKNNTIV